MPIPEERLRPSDRMNIWFAVSSIVMTACILWMIYIDYARPWRATQDQFFVGKAALAHLDYLDATRQEKLDEIAEAEQRLADARQLGESQAGKRAEIRAELDHADLEFKKANAPWSLATQVLEVTKDDYGRVLAAYGPDDPKTKKSYEKFHEEELEVERLRKEKETWEDKRRELEAALRELDQPVRDAQKKVDDLRLVAETARQKDMQYRGVLTDTGLLAGLPIVSKVINAPLGDFVAPMNTPGRHQVNQLVLPDVRQRLNYLETYTTDRCTTCHVAIADPEFSPDRLARKLERSIPGISEELQRRGRPAVNYPAPPKLVGADEVLPEGQVTQHWDKLNPGQQQEYFDALLAIVNDYLAGSGRKTLQLEQPLLAHPHLDLYLTPDSAHPMATMGCTVCHEGNPQETDFVQAAHSPPTHKIADEWKEKYYIKILGVPNVTFDTITHFWERPMRLPQHTEAGCAKCHTEINDIVTFRSERHGAVINAGQQLFREVGCINCHSVDSLKDSPRVGPDLRRIAHKLRPEFVQQWAYFPQKFRPSTLMPHFFLQENNNAGSENQFDPEPELRTKTEVAAMTKYLFAVSNKDWKPLEKPEGVVGDADRGRELFMNVGCLACHSNLAEFGEEWITKDLVNREMLDQEKALHTYKAMSQEEREHYAMEHFAGNRDTYTKPETVRFNPDEYNVPIFSRFAPELSGVGSKVTFDWLYSWLIEPQHYSLETKMPSLRLNPQEASDIATYLLTLKNDDFLQAEFPMDQPAKDMADDLIFQLLAAQRSERRSRAVMEDEGGELSDMLVAGLKSSTEFGFDEPTRLTNAKTLISAMSLEEKKMTFLGSKMIGHYGCYACHSIAGFETTTPPGTDLTTWAEKPITQLDFAFYDYAFHDMRHEKEDVFGYVYPKDDRLLNLLSPIPDDQKEEITHTHGAFAEHKLLNPRIWDREKIKRPYDKLKMPNFYLNREESAALTTYMLSRVPPRVGESLKVQYETDVLGPVARGRALTRELNCIACHQIEDNVPIIQQYFRRDIGGKLGFDIVNAPPLLWSEGAKVQHHWLHSFLKNVVPLRPWLQIRMPSYNLTNDEATDLVEYFAAMSQHDSRQLARTMTPINEHFMPLRKKLLGIEAESEDWGDEAKVVKADPDWFADPGLERPVEDLRDWAVDRLLVRPDEIDPLKTPAARVAAAHTGLLEKARFLRDLNAVEYPFVEPPVPLTSQERYELGQNFLVDMGCLKCHVLGPMMPGPAKNTDEFVQTYRLDGVRGEGSNAVAVLNGQSFPIGAEIDGHKLISAENVYYASGDFETKAVVEGPGAGGETERVLLVAPSAPNLGLTSQRLQRDWLYYWMLNPQWIQPGTKMPMNFPMNEDREPTSPFEGDEKYPGTGTDHINLLIDYLYDAGMRNARVPLPKLEAPAESDEFEEGGSEEFED